MSVLPKKILTGALLLIVAVPVFFSVTFVIKQELIQNQMKERLEQVSLQTITVPLSEITWIKKDKEAIINNQHFDVKSVKISGNNAILKGLFDDVEDHLIAGMKSAVQQKKETTTGQAQYIFLPLYSESISFSIQREWNVIEMYFTYYNNSITKGHFSSVVPPPKSC